MPVTESDYGAERAAPDAAPARPGGTAAAARRRLAAWAVPFAATLGVLLARNAFLFTTPEYERADMGANSILIEQARRFTLLVGNYSRKGFNHPGPGFLYVESWGESVFWAMLRLVPTAWNGQLIAVYALNALFASCVVAVAYGWTRSARGGLAAGAAVGCFAAVHPAAFSSDWMPYVYVPAFLVFTVVAGLGGGGAGRGEYRRVDRLAVRLVPHPRARGVPVHRAGHGRRRRRGPYVALAAFPGPAAPGGRRSPAGPGRWPGRGAVAPPAGVAAGRHHQRAVRPADDHASWRCTARSNFARYFAYGSSSSAGGHSAAQVTHFVLWFWWPGGGAWAAPVLLTAAAVALTALLPAGPVRRLCRSLLLTDALAVAMVVGYAVVGVDVISDYYIGYFSWGAPAVLLLVLLLAATELLAAGRGRPRRVRPPVASAMTRPRAATAVAAVAALAACAAFAAAPATRTSTTAVDPANPRAGVPTDPELPAAVAAMGKLAAGRTIVLVFPHDGWSDVTGILVQAGRTGVPACVASKSWAFLMSQRSICTPSEARDGYRMSVYPDGQIPPGAHPAARLQRAIVTPGTLAT